MCHFYYERIVTIKRISLERGKKELSADKTKRSYIEPSFRSEEYRTFFQRLFALFVNKFF